MNDYLISWYEDSLISTSSLSPKKNRRKKKKEFVLNIEALFHSDLYGPKPKVFSTPLPGLKQYLGKLPDRLVPFNVAYANKDYNCTVHFFIDDSLFIRVLRKPEKYVDFFKKCHSVIGTDLSQYADMSAEDRYYCHYINRAFSAFLQKNGVKLIANVTWSLPDSYYYCWSSLPTNSIIAINCKGVMQHDVSMYLWMKGYAEACKALRPSLIIRYGSKMPGESERNSIYFENERLNYLRYGRKRKF